MDGWNTEALSNLIQALEDAQTLAYEINCCVKGAYSGAHTYEELKEYAEKVADRIRIGAEDCDYAFFREEESYGEV